MEEELHLGLALSTYSYHNNKKRTLEHTLEIETTCTTSSSTNPPTLSLLPDHQYSCQSSTTTNTKSDDETDTVGWPPVNYRRKKFGYNDENEVVSIDHDNHNIQRRNYVKVKMEGVGIARKVNLTRHHSFHTLNQTLMDMFGKCDDDQTYDLVYQDKEGDWLLAQDVSWRSFIQCAQRLKLLKRR